MVEKNQAVKPKGTQRERTVGGGVIKKVNLMEGVGCRGRRDDGEEGGLRDGLREGKLIDEGQ